MAAGVLLLMEGGNLEEERQWMSRFLSKKHVTEV
jgi:hypothetical protein